MSSALMAALLAIAAAAFFAAGRALIKESDRITEEHGRWQPASYGCFMLGSLFFIPAVFGFAVAAALELKRLI